MQDVTFTYLHPADHSYIVYRVPYARDVQNATWVNKGSYKAFHKVYLHAEMYCSPVGRTPPPPPPRVGGGGESYSPVVTFGFDERFYIIRNICCIHRLKKNIFELGQKAM